LELRVFDVARVGEFVMPRRRCAVAFGQVGAFLGFDSASVRNASGLYLPWRWLYRTLQIAQTEISSM